MVAIDPLSRYRKGSVGSPFSTRRIWRAQCRPDWMATGASWAHSSVAFLGTAAASPTAHTFVLSTSRRSAVTLARPPGPGVTWRSWPSVPLAVTPAAQMTAAVSRRSPSAKRIACSSTSTTERPNSISTPILVSSLRA